MVARQNRTGSPLGPYLLSLSLSVLTLNRFGCIPNKNPLSLDVGQYSYIQSSPYPGLYPYPCRDSGDVPLWFGTDIDIDSGIKRGPSESVSVTRTQSLTGYLYRVV